MSAYIYVLERRAYNLGREKGLWFLNLTPRCLCLVAGVSTVERVFSAESSWRPTRRGARSSRKTSSHPAPQQQCTAERPPPPCSFNLCLSSQFSRSKSSSSHGKASRVAGKRSQDTQHHSNAWLKPLTPPQVHAVVIQSETKHQLRRKKLPQQCPRTKPPPPTNTKCHLCSMLSTSQGNASRVASTTTVQD